MQRVPMIPAAILIAALALLFIPLTGIDADEAFFTWPIYGRFDPHYGITVLHRGVTLMVFPYIGALKTLLWWPLLRICGASVWSLRVHAMLIGVATLLLLFPLVERIAGRRAAVVACLLLATDASFVLTETFDWGPVAVEHLLLVGGCLLIIVGRPVGGSLLFGLAFWNKAVF